MNKKSGLVLRVILGGYLVFLGVSLLTQMIQMRPSDMVLKSGFAVIFILIGGFYTFQNIRGIYRMIKAESEAETEPDTSKENAASRFEKVQHDASLYRTAPMPVQEIVTLSSQEKETEKEEKEK